MRAVVDNPTLLDMVGTEPTRVRTAAWVIGATFARPSGILIAPVLGLDAALLTLLVVQAFGAVAIGRFSSLPLTFLGGLAVGVIASLATKYLASKPLFNGLPSAIPFLVLIAVLLVTPKSRLPREVGRTGGAPDAQPWLPVSIRRPLYAAGAALLALRPDARREPSARLHQRRDVRGHLPVAVAAGPQLGADLAVPRRLRRPRGDDVQPPLGSGQGLSWPVALLGAGLVTIPLGAVLAIPAIRLSGLYLALATFGFGILMQSVVFNTSFMFGNQPFLRAPRPTLGPFNGANDTTFYYMVLGVAVVCCLVVLAVDRSRLGRLLRALGDSPTALTTGGLSVNVTRIMVFCLSAFLAGIGGALFMAQFGQVSKDYGFGPVPVAHLAGRPGHQRPDADPARLRRRRPAHRHAVLCHRPLAGMAVRPLRAHRTGRRRPARPAVCSCGPSSPAWPPGANLALSAARCGPAPFRTPT